MAFTGRRSMVQGNRKQNLKEVRGTGVEMYLHANATRTTEGGRTDD